MCARRAMLEESEGPGGVQRSNSSPDRRWGWEEFPAETTSSCVQKAAWWLGRWGAAAKGGQAKGQWIFSWDRTSVSGCLANSRQGCVCVCIVHVYIHECVHVYACICMDVYVCMCVYMCNIPYDITWPRRGGEEEKEWEKGGGTNR